MLETDISLLKCPVCNTSLSLHKVIDSIGEAIKDGMAICDQCELTIPIIDHVIVFLSKEAARTILGQDQYKKYLSYSSVATASSLSTPSAEAIQSGVNWNEQFADKFQMSEELLQGDGFYGERAFWDYCGLTHQHIENKNVCIYCGGSGREVYHALKASPNKVFVIDIGSHIFQIPEFCKNDLQKIVLILSDFFQNPVSATAIDVSICDHALQHIENNQAAFSYLVSKTKRNGLTSICVYSHENNALMTNVVEPMKGVLHKLNARGLRYVALLPAAMLYALQAVYSLLEKKWPSKTKKLPFYSLLYLWRKEGFSKFHEACFDLLHAPVSYHFKRDELVGMTKSSALEILDLTMINRTMWRLVAQKTSASPTG